MTDMSQTKKFIATLSQTPPLASRLGDNLRRLKENNQQIIKYLTYPKTVAGNLTKLYDNLNITYELLTFVSVIPAVGQAAGTLKTSVNLLRREVKPARDAAVRLEAKVKPLREQLKKLDPVLADAIKQTETINSTSSTFLTKFKAVNDCINSLPDGKPKEVGQNYLNQFSAKYEPDVANLNKALEAASSVIETFYSKLEELRNKLNPLSAIDSAINDVLRTLKPLIDQLNNLKHSLTSIKIPIPLPYPHMVSLYDIFKTLGRFIDLAMKPIQSLVDKILALLKIKLPQIPGLNILINLKIDIPSIPDFAALLQAIRNPFDQFKLGIDLFKLDCPPAPDQTDFTSQLSKQ